MNASRTSWLVRGCEGARRRAEACAGRRECRCMGAFCVLVCACAPACGGGAMQRGAAEEEAATQLQRGRGELLLPEHLVRMRLG